jgi:mono/diheme cytochrome c family protein
VPYLGNKSHIGVLSPQFARVRFFIYLTIFVLLLVACGQDTQEEEPSPVKAGELVFQQNCMGCHTTTGAVKTGPGLGRLFEREKLVNGQNFSRENLKQLIQQGSNGGRMPGTRLSDEELEQLLLYLEQATK